MHKQWYIIGHLSLTWSLALDILSGVATVRDQQRCSQKRDFRGAFLGHLSFWISGVESPFIFLYEKIRKN